MTLWVRSSGSGSGNPTQRRKAGAFWPFPFAKATTDFTGADCHWQPALYPSVLPATVRKLAPHEQDKAAKLARFRCRKSLVITPDGTQHLVLADDRTFVQVMAEGADILADDTAVTYHIDGLDGRATRQAETWHRLVTLKNRPASGRRKRKPTQQVLRLRECLMALDGRLAGASDRDIAIRLYGLETVAENWRTGDDSLRARTRRRIARGLRLMNGE